MEELQETLEATYASFDSLQNPTSHGGIDGSEDVSPASQAEPRRRRSPLGQGLASREVGVTSDGRGGRRGSSITERGQSEDQGPGVRNDLMDLSTPRA